MPKTGFRPEKDGYAFINSWQFDAYDKQRMEGAITGAVGNAVNSLGGGAGKMLKGTLASQVTGWLAGAVPDGYGLCGGMTFSSRDYFLAKKPIPRGKSETDHPDPNTDKGKALRDYLWRRQLESLQLNAPQLLGWMFMLHLPDFFGGPDWLHDRAKEEWVKLKAHLDKDGPWPICLIGSSTSPFNNHQVLAYGYDDNGAGMGVIYVYDMNAPNHEQTIQLDMRGRTLVAKESVPNAARGPLRGFFCEAYTPVDPPRL
jgi:hypothetical protein